jgi:hypothetical protein
MRITYNGYIGTQSPAKKLDLTNSEEYAMLRNESQENAGLPIIFEQIDTLGEGTDWQDAIFEKNALLQNHEVSISGGNNRSSFYSSFGYYGQEGIVTPDISNYQRI